ncbi:heavy metal-associated isoprenylated plant protein 36 [Malania oleifera]|uniref:heavy metal-associated isoprenylated plant protein 36 n=1 Tax=Malania oleifera TaxID=397392 RepID=UPI0025ADA29D|nr:heavy metal-associated isoprenylated plant protein 36 [Malania oleifera]
MANLQIVAAAGSGKVVEAQYVEMMVPLYSYGCERKVKKALSHLRGIYSVNVEYKEQKVTVWGICNKYDVLATIKSKRKDARFWNPQDNDEILSMSEFTQPPTSPAHGHYHPSRKTTHTKLPLTLSLKFRSLSLSRSNMINSSWNWRSLKKSFIRSYSF